jgi:hypothetical protein
VFLPSGPLGDLPGTLVCLWPRGPASPRGRSGRSGHRFEETGEGWLARAATFPAPPAASGRAPASHTADAADTGEGPVYLPPHCGIFPEPSSASVRVAAPHIADGAATGLGEF